MKLEDIRITVDNFELGFNDDMTEEESDKHINNFLHDIRYEIERAEDDLGE